MCVPGGPGFDPEAYFTDFELPGHEVLVFAPRGTGGSSVPLSPEAYRMAGYVDDIEGLRRHLKLRRLTLYGNSYGGSVVLAYACAYPNCVAQLVISNACARVDAAFEEAVARARQRFAEAVRDGAERLAAAEAADAAAEADASEATSWSAFRTSMACAVAREGSVEKTYLDRLCSAPDNSDAVQGMWVEWRAGIDLLKGAEAVGARALILAGELDTVVPPPAVQLIADTLPNARYLEFPGVGHFLPVEASEQFRATVCDFLGAGFLAGE